MNTIEDRPEGSDKTKALIMAAVFGALGVLVAGFWFAMRAVCGGIAEFFVRRKHR